MEADSFKKIKKDLDEIAKHLGRLKNLGVPVLWRPLHEASGGWFWWGASGEDAYKALYKYMYTYFTEEKNLDNLIWIWNGQNEKWYPGDDYVDIVGEDIYSNDHSSQKLSFLLSKNITDGNKMVCLSECGRIPDPICCKQDNACWLYFMVWNDATTSGSVFTKEDFWSSSVVNSLEFRQKVYSSPFVITLDKVKPGDYK